MNSLPPAKNMATTKGQQHVRDKITIIPIACTEPMPHDSPCASGSPTYKTLRNGALDS